MYYQELPYKNLKFKVGDLIANPHRKIIDKVGSDYQEILRCASGSDSYALENYIVTQNDRVFSNDEVEFYDKKLHKGFKIECNIEDVK